MIERAEDPLRLQPAFDPVRLVLGWSQADDENEPRPVLAGTNELPHPQLVMYEPVRSDAEELAKRFAKSARTEVRNAKVQHTLDAIDKKIEAFSQRVDAKIDGFEKRLYGAPDRSS